jgi:dipeptidyl aminopeptidase/acylaminoacyl peptidase
MVADIVIEESGTVVVQNSTHIAGQKTTNSATYPGWATNTTVVFTSDISGYQNPWKYDLERREATPVFSKAVEEDFGEPGWGLGRSPYAVLDAEGWTLFAAFKDGRHVLYAVNIVDGRRMFLDNPYVEILNMRSCGTEKVVFIGEKVDTEPQLPICTVSTANPNFTAVFSLATHPSASLPFSPSFFSVAQPMTLKAGPDGRSIHILYYPPTNPEYVGSSVDGERPPCVVYAHGGPTHYSGHGLNMMTQYYTSRGWAWCDIFHVWHTDDLICTL